MDRLLRIALFSLALTCAGSAHAQFKLGEVLDKGGKPLSAEEVRALVTGAKMSGNTATGGMFEGNYSADGKVGGTIAGTQGMSGMAGTWMVNERGQLCSDITVTRSGQTQKGCAFVFKAGAEYFTSGSTEDRNANALKRSFSR